MGGHARLDERLLRDPRHRPWSDALPVICVLDNGTPEELAQRGFDRPQIAVINGMVKPNAGLFSDAEYRKNVRDLGDDYRATMPRRIAE